MVKPVTFEDYKKKLKSFKQYRDMPEAEFEKVVKAKYDARYVDGVRQEEETVALVKNEIGAWLNQAEAEDAEELYNTYSQKNNITTFADLALLKVLVAGEIQLKRLQEKMTSSMVDKSGKKKDTDYVSSALFNAFTDLNKEMMTVRKSLGLTEEKKTQDPFEHINTLKKKFKVWLSNNQGSRTLRCPHCSKMIMLVIKTEAWDALKHPFFKDLVLDNPAAWRCYKEGKISSLDLAKILLGEETKTDLYVHWLEEKRHVKPAVESGD